MYMYSTSIYCTNKSSENNVKCVQDRTLFSDKMCKALTSSGELLGEKRGRELKCLEVCISSKTCAYSNSSNRIANYANQTRVSVFNSRKNSSSTIHLPLHVPLSDIRVIMLFSVLYAAHFTVLFFRIRIFCFLARMRKRCSCKHGNWIKLALANCYLFQFHAYS